MAKVMLAMSGGVDSSVAVAVLQEAGHEVEGITMCLGDETVAEKAQRCASFFGIRHHVVDLKQTFEKAVVAPFVSAYQSGKTPNPCVRCNERVKFGVLFQYAEQFGFDYFATGHYAKVVQVGTRYTIQRADYLPKDQSYVLYPLPQTVLRRLLLPLGAYSKTEIRAKAEALGLAAAKQKDSQDICFIPDGNYRGFLQNRGVQCPTGNFVDLQGNVLGQHQGITNYTIGQRKGLGIALGHPVFVVGIVPERNEVVLGLEQDLLQRQMWTGENHFCSIDRLTKAMAVAVKVRYKSPAVPAVIEPLGDDLVQVTFAAPEKAITPGQSAVFYQGDLVLGGGIIL